MGFSLQNYIFTKSIDCCLNVYRNHRYQIYSNQSFGRISIFSRVCVNAQVLILTTWDENFIFFALGHFSME